MRISVVFTLFSVTLWLFSSLSARAAVFPPCPAGADEIPTEIGTLCTDPPTLIQDFVIIIVGIAGGISFILLAIGAIKYVFSAGNPETVDDAKSNISHAVSGLLLVVLSVFLLRLVGIDILRIPGLRPGSAPGSITTP